MGLFGRLFGSDKVIEKTAEGIYNGVDKLVYTDEEKAEMRLKGGQMFLSLLKAYEPFKLAQRLIALLITIPYILVWLASAAIFVYGGLNKDLNAVEISKELSTMNIETLGTHLAIILAFYFTGGMLEGVVSKAKGGKG